MPLTSLFRTPSGQIVIAQWPNRPLWLAIGFWFLKHFPHPAIANLANIGLILSLTYWSYLEIRYGVNTWRRLLGTTVLLWQIWTVIQYII